MGVDYSYQYEQGSPPLRLELLLSAPCVEVTRCADGVRVTLREGACEVTLCLATMGALKRLVRDMEVSP